MRALYILLFIFGFSSLSLGLTPRRAPPIKVKARPVEDLAASFRKKYEHRQTALQDAVHANGFDVSKRDEFPKSMNREYTNKIPLDLVHFPIRNQRWSGKCWIYAFTNYLRIRVGQQHILPDNFAFSESYLHFYRMLEDANSYINNAITGLKAAGVKDQKIIELANQELRDGGWYSDVLSLIEKYGLVPANAMKDYSAAMDDGRLIEELNIYLKKEIFEMANLADKMRKSDSLEQRFEKVRNAEATNTAVQLAPRKPLTPEQVQQLEAKREQIIEGIYSILVLGLGTPPETFTARVKTPTANDPAKVEDKEFNPKSFAKLVGAGSSDDFVNISALPSRVPMKTYELNDGRKQAPMKYLNLPMGRLDEIISASLARKEPVYFAAQFNDHVDMASGAMHEDIKNQAIESFMRPGVRPLTMSRKLELITDTVSANHAMLIVGEDKPDSSKPAVKHLVLNSWGKEAGDGGFFHMDEGWSQHYLSFITVPRYLLNQKELESWDGKTIKVDAEEQVQSN